MLPRPVTRRSELTLTDRDYHYLVRVLRLQVNDAFDAVDSTGRACTCAITSIDREGCTVSVESAQTEDTPQEPAPRITLYQCLPKGAKLDAIVRQATECGVAEIVPVSSERTVARLPEERVASRLNRWRRIAREAVQQSGAAEPAVLPPISIDEVCRHWQERGQGLIFHQDCLDSSRFLDTLIRAPDEVAVCIGPEGGFTDGEVSAFTARGFVPIHLGTGVLRTETAALYAIAAVQVYVRTAFPERYR